MLIYSALDTVRKLRIDRDMIQLPEKYKENFDCSDEYLAHLLVHMHLKKKIAAKL
jgi:hypothetical protein